MKILEEEIKEMERIINKYEKVVGKNQKCIAIGNKIAITTKFPFIHFFKELQ